MKIINSIICDDVRNEIGGKNTLVGIYGDTVKIGIPKSAGPAANVFMKLCFFFTLRKESVEEWPDGFSVVFTRRGVDWPIVRGKFDRIDELRKNNIANIVIMLPSFPTGGEGPISRKIDFTKGEQIMQSITIDDFSIEIERI